MATPLRATERPVRPGLPQREVVPGHEVHRAEESGTLRSASTTRRIALPWPLPTQATVAPPQTAQCRNWGNPRTVAAGLMPHTNASIRIGQPRDLPKQVGSHPRASTSACLGRSPTPWPAAGASIRSANQETLAPRLPGRMNLPDSYPTQRQPGRAHGHPGWRWPRIGQLNDGSASRPSLPIKAKNPPSHRQRACR